MGRNKFLYMGLMSVLALALAFFATTYWKASRQLRTVTSANEFLKKTVGEMAQAISAKDRELDRLIKAPCQSKRDPQLASPETHTLKQTLYD